jgi:hypothetical protein
VRTILDHFARRKYNQNISPLDALERALEGTGTPLPRHVIIDTLRRLDALGIGRFIPGRKGYPTRFEWNEKSMHVQRIATAGEPNAFEQPA